MRKKIVNAKTKNIYSGVVACRKIFSKRKMASAKTTLRSNMASAKTKHRYSGGVACRNIFLKCKMASAKLQNRMRKGEMGGGFVQEMMKYNGLGVVTESNASNYILLMKTC